MQTILRILRPSQASVGNAVTVKSKTQKSTSAGHGGGVGDLLHDCGSRVCDYVTPATRSSVLALLAPSLRHTNRLICLWAWIDATFVGCDAIGGEQGSGAVR